MSYPPVKKDPSWLGQVPTALRQIWDAIVGKGVESLATTVVAGVSLATLSAGLAFAGSPDGRVAGTALAIFTIGAIAGRVVFSRFDSAALNYYNAARFNESREAWPPERSLLFFVDGDVRSDGALTLRIRVTNIAPVAWTVRGAVAKKLGFMVAYGMGITADMAVEAHNRTLDQGESTVVVLTGRLEVPSGVALEQDRWRWGVVGSVQGSISISVEAPESPDAPSLVPVNEKTLLADGSVWKDPVQFVLRVVA